MTLFPALALLALGILPPAAPPAAPGEGGDAGATVLGPRGGEESSSLPRSVENPGTAGARFGLGIDLLSDRLDGIEESASETVVTLVGPDGAEERFVRPGDPDLTNRKFDVELDLRALGVQVPVALPSFHLGPAVAVSPSLVLELALVDAELDYAGRTEADAGSSLEGEGPMLGVGLDWVATACRRCRLFWGGGYRYRLLPDLAVDRSPEIRPTHLQVLRDEVRLSAESHRLTGRLGYALRGGRLAPYVGARYRAAEVEVEDELRLLAPELGEETGLRTESTLDSDGVAGIVGVDVALGERYAARVEVALGDDDASALLKVVGFVGGVAGPSEREDRVAELLEYGPQVERSRRRVEVEGVLAGGWPLVAGYVLPEDGVLRLTIDAPGIGRVEYELPGGGGRRESEALSLPESSRRSLVAGTLVAEAVSAAGDPIPFDLQVLAAGPGAVASEPITEIEAMDVGEWPAKQLAYRYQLTRRFDRGRDSFWRWPDPPADPEEPVWSEELDAEDVRSSPCLGARAPCNGDWQVPRAGTYFVQVTAWSERAEVGSNGWAVAISKRPVEFRR